MLHAMSRKEWCVPLQKSTTLTAALYLEALTHTNAIKLSPPQTHNGLLHSSETRALRTATHTWRSEWPGATRKLSSPPQALLAHCPALPASSLHITPRVLVAESVVNKPTAPAPPRAHVKRRALCDPELPTERSHSPDSE